MTTRSAAASANTGAQNDHAGTRGLDPAQQSRLDRVIRDAALLYPDNPDLQRAAVAAARDYLLGHADPAAAGAALAAVRRAERLARARARQIAVMAFADGRSERAVAREVGVDRMNLRRWLGKTAPRATTETVDLRQRPSRQPGLVQ